MKIISFETSFNILHFLINDNLIMSLIFMDYSIIMNTYYDQNTIILYENHIRIYTAIPYIENTINQCLFVYLILVEYICILYNCIEYNIFVIPTAHHYCYKNYLLVRYYTIFYITLSLYYKLILYRVLGGLYKI